ncbi:hypothetical protein L1049_025916 [Liquidambar formosana]|uniref:FHA domain-containing protein n=1 Tax=Liquidambar formosana TaxID=63359 RepID=A0AAP0NDT2_LIQFO
MGAVAPISAWIPEDDLLLKNAVEAGASLESLAKGAVQFSRRFTVRELQERWHSLLYDPVVSAEASDRMIEFERSALNLPSKSSRFGNAKENKCVPGKRKAESVRSCYYAMRKRICNEPFNSMDLSFLVAPGDNNCLGNGDEPPSANCMLGDPISNHYELEQSNLDLMHRPFPQVVTDGAAASSVGGTAYAFHTEPQNGIEGEFPVEQSNIHKETPHILGENLSLIGNCSGVEEMGRSEEMPVCNLFEADHLEAKPPTTFDQVNRNSGNVCSGFGGSQVFNSPISDCGAPFHSLGYSSPLAEMPIWRTIEGISEPAMPVDVGLAEEDHCAGDTFAFPDDGGAKNTSTSGYDVTHSDSNLKNQIPCGEMKCSPASTEGYLVELSNSLLNFTNEEELLFMDVDGKDVIDKSYFDGLSSLLLNSPNDVNQDQLPNIAELEASASRDSYLVIPDGAYPGVLNDNGGSQYVDGNIVCNSDVQMSSSSLALNSQFPELRDGVICCTLNTEDSEIPCNDDVFLPCQMPSSLSPVTKQNFHEAKIPNSSIVNAFSDNGKPSERAPSLVNRERKNPGQSHMSSQLIGSQVLAESDSSHLVSRSAGIAYGGPSQISLENVRTNSLLPKTVKEEPSEIELVKHHSYNSTDCFLENPGHGSDGFKSYPQTGVSCGQQEVNRLATIQNHQALPVELESVDMAFPETVVNPSTSDQEEQPLGSDDDIPYFSDIEAMILDMDLGPDDQDFYFSGEVSRYQHEDARRAIIRLEQSAHSYMQRAIASHGAFAVLYGRHSKHYIKKPEVLLGRTTEDVIVDIDLGREGRPNKISRRQAIINMDKSGTFYLKNLGKLSILVNNKEVAPGQSLSLNSSCLIEIRGMPFVFETNQSCVKQYIDKIIRISQTEENKV